MPIAGATAEVPASETETAAAPATAVMPALSIAVTATDPAVIEFEKLPHPDIQQP